MNDALLAVALAQIPDQDTIIQPPSPEFDEVAGGLRGTSFGGPAWAYYVTYVHPGVSGGSTCSTFLAYWMSLAGGWPAEMIDRAKNDPVAPGGGFTPGLSLSKIIGGARKRGWYRSAPSDGVDLQTGDIYHVNHVGHPNSDHVGLIRTVGDLQPDGSREVGTIDGGQSPGGAAARWQSRILSADGKTISLDGAPAHLLGVVRVPHAGP